MLFDVGNTFNADWEGEIVLQNVKEHFFMVFSQTGSKHAADQIVEPHKNASIKLIRLNIGLRFFKQLKISMI